MRVYTAQMERKESDFNQTEFNKALLENVLKTQFAMSKLLAMESLSPHLKDDTRFDFKSMVINIKDDAHEVVTRFFPNQNDENDG